MRIVYPVAHTFAEVGVTDLFTFWDDDNVK